MNRMLALVLFSSCVALHAQEVDDLEPVVDPPRIIEGYDQTKWGQSPAELQVVVPGAQLVKEKRGYAQYVAPGKGKITEIQYQFLNDQLFKIRLTLDLRDDLERKDDPVGVKLLQQTIKKKYSTDPRIIKLLHEADILISVSPAPNATAYVMYWNSNTRRQIEQAQRNAKAAKEKQELAKRQAAQQAVEELAEKDGL